MKQFEAKYNRSDIEKYLMMLSKEIKKEFGRNVKVELVIVGGAAILLNYNFRETTMDIDAYISTGESIKSVATKVADKNNLSEGWLNSDFMMTKSFTHNLTTVSTYYKTFNQVLDVRTIKDEYLIAMKLKSFRKYKFDLSDVANIFYSIKGEGEKKIKQIKEAYSFLYEEKLEGERLAFLEKISVENIDYNQIKKYEEINSNIVKIENSKKRITEDNLDEVLGSIENI